MKSIFKGALVAFSLITLAAPAMAKGHCQDGQGNKVKASKKACKDPNKWVEAPAADKGTDNAADKAAEQKPN
jgi:hypothetical protein